MPKPKPKDFPLPTWEMIEPPSINKIVATAQMNTGRVNLALIHEQCRNSKYKPTSLNAVIVKLREPSATSLIFATGKIVVIHTKTIDDSRDAAAKVVKMVKKFYPKAHLTNFKIENISSSINYTFCIDLESLAKYCEKIGMPQGKDGYQY